MIQAKCDRPRIEPRVLRVQDCAKRRHRVMRFEQRRRVRGHDRDGIAASNSASRERRGKASAAHLEFAISVLEPTVANRNPIRPYRRAPLEERHRRQRHMVRRILGEVAARGGCVHWIAKPASAAPSRRDPAEVAS